MHIIFVTSEIPTKKNYGGGLATFTANMAEIFASRGNQVEVFYVTTKDEHEEYDCVVNVKNIFISKEEWDIYDNVSRIYYEGKEAGENRQEILNIIKSKEVKDEIYRIHMRNKVDIVHFCNHGSFSLMMDDGIPYVIRISGYLNILHGGGGTASGSLEYRDNPLSIGDKLEVYTFRRARNIFAPSKLLADIGKKNLGLNIDVLESPYIMNAITWDDHIYASRLIGKEYILFFGNLRYVKGIQVIADLIERMLGKWTDRYLVLAGVDMEVFDDNGNLIKASEYLKQRAGRYSDRVIYLGKIRKSELYPVITNAIACLLPSRIENLSNACIESMALGKIVIATAGASFEQLITDGENGFLCERDNADSFLLGIEKVFGLSAEKKQRIEDNAKSTVKRLEADTIYEIFLNYYQNIIDMWKL